MLGSLENGKYADLIVVDGAAGDAYEQLIRATEVSLTLVIIAGTRRLGASALMLGVPSSDQEQWTIAGKHRILNLADPAADPLVQGLSLDSARSTLEDGLKNLKQLAKDLEAKTAAPRVGAAPSPLPSSLGVSLYLDHEEPDAYSMRPMLASRGAVCCAPAKASALMAAKPQPPLSQLLGPLALDKITVADDSGYIAGVKTQLNLPKPIRDGLVSWLGG